MTEETRTMNEYLRRVRHASHRNYMCLDTQAFYRDLRSMGFSSQQAFNIAATRKAQAILYRALQVK